MAVAGTSERARIEGLRRNAPVTTKTIILLHNANDSRHLNELEQVAIAALPATWELWRGDSQGEQRIVALGAHACVDEQIQRAIHNAYAVVYLVGSTGAGPYQSTKEMPWVQEALQARATQGDPLRFVPVLLREGLMSGFAAWMHQYPIVNLGRNLNAHRIWEGIVHRLEQPVEHMPVESSLTEQEELDLECADEIVRALGQRENLTVFIGPYAPPDRAEVGPAALTMALLKGIGIQPYEMLPLLPWPSEAAEWMSLLKHRFDVDQLLVQMLTALKRHPSDIAVETAHLASEWITKKPSSNKRRDWNGLLLLTTRVDQALESALLRAQVPFTRLIPTLMDETKKEPLLPSLKAAPTPSDKRKMLQVWKPGLSTTDGDQDLPGSWEDIEVVSPNKVSLDDAESVVLVKLCGTVEITSSMMITVSDFFTGIQTREGLPSQMREAIQNSPQLLIGRGFASPLAHLIRLSVLQTRLHHQLRVLVMPPHDAAQPGLITDSLCDVESKLLDTPRNEEALKQTMELTALRRTAPARFLGILARAL